VELFLFEEALFSGFGLARDDVKFFRRLEDDTRKVLLILVKAVPV